MTLIKRRRIVAALIGVLALAALGGPAVAQVERPDRAGGGSPAGSKCTGAESRRALALEQRRMLRLTGEFRVLRNQADLDRLAVPDPATGSSYSFYSHMFASMQGVGFTVVNIGTVAPGIPSFLLYRPSREAEDLLDPFGPDFPYQLVGWGYVSPYVPGAPPAWPDDPGLRCLQDKDWFVHERSVHPADTWQNIVVPPAERFQGEVPGEVPPTAAECQCEVGISHGRFWDVHLWLGRSGRHPIPTVSVFNPGRAIPGFDPVLGVGFFFPEKRHPWRTGQVPPTSPVVHPGHGHG